MRFDWPTPFLRHLPVYLQGDTPVLQQWWVESHIARQRQGRLDEALTWDGEWREVAVWAKEQST